MRPVARSAVSSAPVRWAGPVLLSVGVHLALAGAWLFFGNLYTPPRPPDVLAVEVVLASDLPDAGAVRSTEPPAESVASAPAAPAESRPEARKTPDAERTPKETAKAEVEPVPADLATVAAKEPAVPPETPPLPEPTKPKPVSVAAIAPEPLPGPPKPQPMPNAEPVRLVIQAPLPRRKPVLNPPPISAAEKASPVVQPVARPAPLAVAKKPPDAPPSEVASAASAGAATARLIPPRYAAPGRGNPLPIYPHAARRRGIEGRLMLRVHVDAVGRADMVEIVKTSGHRLLDAAAEQAVRKWRFVPARRAGIAVPATIDVPVVFRLKD